MQPKDVLLRVKEAYWRHYVHGKKKVAQEMPDGWTDAIFECFRKYMKALDELHAIKTVRTPPPVSPGHAKRARTNDDQASSPSSSPSLRPTVNVDIGDN